MNRLLHREKRLAFTLVEVVLALGVVSFALLGIVALLPVGIQSTKDSLEESNAINVLSGIIADRRASDPTLPSTNYQIPALTAAASNCFGVTTNNALATSYSQALYRVTYVITQPTGMGPYQIYYKVSWPAGAASTTAAGYVEQVSTIAQP